MLWKADGREDGISIPWTKVAIHAICSYPHESVYLQIDYRLLWPGVLQIQNGSNGNGNGDLSDNDDDVDEGNYDGKNDTVAMLPIHKGIFILDEDSELTQMWFTPAEFEEVAKIYNIMVQCQILNPELDDSLSEDGEILINYKMCAYNNIKPMSY